MISPVSKTDEAMFIRGFKSRCENIAIQIRLNLGLKDSEPLSAFELAEYLGVWIWELDEIPNLPRETLKHLGSVDGDEWSAVAVQSGAQDVIVLNPTHSPARQSNDLMHELAHIILQHEPSQIVVSDTTGVGLRTFDKRQEAEADWLAACLLLPRSAVAFSHGRKMPIDKAADYFGVSKDLYRYRLRMTGVEKQQAFRRP
jgi:Zn-dependent peptidase ImmA (M78 family)